MNLFVWTGVKALKQYAPGTVVVMAHDIHQAIIIGAADYARRLEDEIPPLDAEDRAEIDKKVQNYVKELAGMNAIVHNYPVAINLKGSE